MTFLNSETLIVALSWIALILMWIGYAKMYRKYIWGDNIPAPDKSEKEIKQSTLFLYGAGFKKQASKLKHGKRTFVFAMFLFWFVFGSIMGAIPGDRGINRFTEFIFVLSMLTFTLQFLRMRRYFLAVFSIIFPIVISALTYFFVGSYTFTFTFYNSGIPVLCTVFIIIESYLFSSTGYLRYILALAGEPVVGIENGYTTRPFPAGSFEYSKEDARDFGNRMEKLAGATAYQLHEKMVIVFTESPTKYFPFITPNFEKYTYVELDFTGNMNVHIAERDYKKFKQELTFDELCRAFGDLIWKFFRYHKEGEHIRIWKELERGQFC